LEEVEGDGTEYETMMMRGRMGAGTGQWQVFCFSKMMEAPVG